MQAILFNQPTSVAPSPFDKHTFAFLNSVEVGAVLGLGCGVLMAARRGSMKPLMNSWGLVSGSFLIFPSLQFFEGQTPKRVQTLFEDEDLKKHREFLFAAALSGSASTLMNGKFFAGAQLGMAATFLVQKLNSTIF